ncbi:helix-turn-helix domain-containing protein [Natronobacterium gregoryi]|uniref:Bacterio-opsin activator n=2 Tax=Natronobacterium gregoryi TaxID=44930 RepID=L0ACP7_NATGS|nr:helix-turn-helix domain-containing protein [Natronobacterium gregoryi]AFZ71668.1 putative DNA binding protein [Natronobacterium gregoryi SP2]ELY72759.1 Bacterio-opsin activator HTH domain-containing protein [Natronobacterium gregoryi SP2]PLK20282.1 bacterio-opsin activator [Natronobacterium gregoryi SP2]SFJ24661.1 hypothetical protein SAMN05443661_1198 [Natronobacterium gregoryi]
MSDGIRVELEVEDGGTCPIVSASRETERPITTVSWSRPDKSAMATEEFTTESDVAPIDIEEINTVFETDSHARHRFIRPEQECVCQVIEASGFPVETVHVDQNGLTLSFYTLDVTEITDVVAKLREQFQNVRIRRLHRAGIDRPGGVEGGDLVWVDRDALTDRQREVLETAHELGYFEYPRGSNATEVADAIGIAPSTFTEHLTTAQSKIMDVLVGEESA